MEFHVEVDSKGVDRLIQSLNRDQIPFATSKAINATALSFQKRQRTHMLSVFEVRNPRFVQKAVKIKPFARKRSLAARVLIEPPGGPARADILGKFEDETRKSPIRGRRLAIPTSAMKRTRTGRIPKHMRPRNLDFKPHGRGRAIAAKGDVFRGKQRTFMILRPGGRGLILQRFGPNLGDTRALYVFRPSVPITPVLGFVDRARETVDQEFPHHFGVAFDYSLRTAA